MDNTKLYKPSAIELKDIDEKKGVVVAYANAYNNKDSDGDISGIGSFTRTVDQNFKRIKVLQNHDTTISLGVPLEIKTDDPYGLLTTTKFNLKKSVSRDMFTDIQMRHEEGLNSDLSIGYNILKRDEKNKSIIKEYKLFEYSFLTFYGANNKAIVQSIKSIMSVGEIIDSLHKLSNRPYSDQRLIQIETNIKALMNGDPLNDTLHIDPLVGIINKFSKNIRNGK